MSIPKDLPLLSNEDLPLLSNDYKYDTIIQCGDIKYYADKKSLSHIKYFEKCYDPKFNIQKDENSNILIYIPDKYCKIINILLNIVNKKLEPDELYDFDMSLMLMFLKFIMYEDLYCKISRFGIDKIKDLDILKDIIIINSHTEQYNFGYKLFNKMLSLNSGIYNKSIKSAISVIDYMTDIYGGISQEYIINLYIYCMKININTLPSIYTYLGKGYTFGKATKKARQNSSKLHRLSKEAGIIYFNNTDTLGETPGFTTVKRSAISGSKDTLPCERRKNTFYTLNWEGVISNNIDYINSLKNINELYKTDSHFKNKIDLNTRSVIGENGNLEEGIKFILQELSFLIVSPKILGVKNIAYVYHRPFTILNDLLDGKFQLDKINNVGVYIVQI